MAGVEESGEPSHILHADETTSMHSGGLQESMELEDTHPQAAAAGNIACAKQLRQKVKKRITDLSEPLNVLLVGQAGAGKSSFINTSIRVLTGKRGFWVTSGAGAGAGRSHVTSTYKKVPVSLKVNTSDPDGTNTNRTEQGQDYQGRSATLRFLDTCGLPDENNAAIQMLLKLLLYGRIPLSTNLLDQLKFGNDEGAKALLEKYPTTEEDLIIHRVVVVCNSDQDFPNNLVKAVMEAAQPQTHNPQADGTISKRVVPVFGLLTKIDKMEDEQHHLQRRKDGLLDLLCLRGNEVKLGECENYVHNQHDTDNKPDIDVNILNFLFIILDDTHSIDNRDYRLETASHTQPVQRHRSTPGHQSPQEPRPGLEPDQHQDAHQHPRETGERVESNWHRSASNYQETHPQDAPQNIGYRESAEIEEDNGQRTPFLPEMIQPYWKKAGVVAASLCVSWILYYFVGHYVEDDQISMWFTTMIIAMINIFILAMLYN